MAIENLRRLPPPHVHRFRVAEGRVDSDILTLRSQDPFGASRISYLYDLVEWATAASLLGTECW
ncbi:MAG: hypothetical protein J2P41_09605 [Blastocatellia bacterium]|nr:hypothetical protein [Blastocatellia bacterium]